MAVIIPVRARINTSENNGIEVGLMKQKILVLDDSPFILMTIGDILRSSITK